ncbi:MAG: hypothetical protein IJ301_02550, partial [Clostridia bacterium]|nr:hypothetical protein [Clostridia bacterium]
TIGNGSYMWLPSFGEVFNNTTSSYTSNTTTYTGQWGLNSTDRAFATSLYADTSSTISYCWLRSGNSRADYRAMLVGSSGSAGSYDVNGSYGVRPAAHISLKSLADFAGYNISASVGSNCSVNYSNQIFYIVAATPITFTYTAKANYYINTLNIDSTTATITDSTTAPSSYTTLTNTQYKAYRSAYGVVTVILYNVSADISISATAAGNITLTNSNTSKISNANFTRATYDTITATITATYASGYYPQFKYNSNEYIKISASGGSGGIGAVAYDYTFSSNVLTLNFSGLPTGISNIPTITLNTHTLGSNNLVVNVSNAVYDIVYESTQTIVNVTPNSGYYITQAYVDSNIAEEIIYLDGTMVNTGNAFTIKYYTSQNSNKVKFILYDLEGSLTLNITLGNTKPELQMASGGAKIDGIAVMSTIGGSAEILGDNYEDLIVGDTITVVARLKLNGYQFDGWYINDELVSTDWSARLTYDEELVGSIVVARFSEISTNINTETDNNSELV